MEENVLPSPEVRRELANFVDVWLFTDGKSGEEPANQQLELKYANTSANPVYAIISPDEKVLGVLEGRTDSNTFARFLHTSLASAGSPANEFAPTNGTKSTSVD